MKATIITDHRLYRQKKKAKEWFVKNKIPYVERK